eukprot:6260180-Pyramimonas_sp.AAC.1
MPRCWTSSRGASTAPVALLSSAALRLLGRGAAENGHSSGQAQRARGAPASAVRAKPRSRCHPGRQGIQE